MDRKLLCPECKEALEVVDGHVVCPQGHTWRIRRGRSTCPRCGERYATFHIPSRYFPLLYRDVYRICPKCGWHEVLKGRYVGPAEGRGHRGQKWSPVTGRMLVR